MCDGATDTSWVLEKCHEVKHVVTSIIGRILALTKSHSTKKDFRLLKVCHGSSAFVSCTSLTIITFERSRVAQEKEDNPECGFML